MKSTSIPSRTLSETDFGNNTASLELNAIELCKVKDKGTVVPYFSQKNPLWSKIQYANLPTKTIGGLGCYITSFAMLMRSYGINYSTNGKLVTPKEINEGLKNTSMYPQLGQKDGVHSGYDAVGGVLAASAASYARNSFAVTCMQKTGDVNGCINQSYSRISYKGPTDSFGPEQFDTVQKELCSGNPIILKVPSLTYPDNLSKAHYVLATGLDLDDVNNEVVFRVNNPAGGADEFLKMDKIRGVRRFKPADDPSMIFIYAPQNVDMVVVDPQGRKTGFNPVSNVSYAEIPGGVFINNEEIDDLENLNVSVGAMKHFEGLEPLNGSYSVQLFSKTDTSYKVTAYSYDLTGTINNIQDFSGSVKSNKPITISLKHDSEPIEVRHAILQLSKALFYDMKHKDMAVLSGYIQIPGQNKNFGIEEFVKIKVGSFIKVVPRKKLRKFSLKGVNYYSYMDSGKDGIIFELNGKTGQFNILIGNSKLDDSSDTLQADILIQLDKTIAIGNVQFKEISKGKKCGR